MHTRCLQCKGNNLLAGGGLGEIMAFKVEDTGIAGIIETITIGTGPVDTYGVALVFDSAGDEQLLPGMAAVGGKISGINQQVECVGISAPNRKAQIVTNEWAYFPSVQLDDEPLLSGAIVKVFPG